MDQLGSLLEGARTRLALSQESLAALVEVSQQTVSSWEKGTTRPGAKKHATLAAILNLAVGDIEAAIATAKADTAAGTLTATGDSDLPVRTLTPVLPFNSLSAKGFEDFVADLLERQYPGSDVSPLGGQGDDQQGYDILVVTADGRRVGVQCKREQNFGPQKVIDAIAEAELAVDASVIALARTATAAARFEIDKYDGWTMWDQADMSRKIRLFSIESALQLLRTHFPSHVEPFLGVKPASPWLSAGAFYRPTSQVLLHHSQALVGRGDLVEAVASWASNSDSSASRVGLLLGRGGLGKSKLFWEAATRTYEPGVYFRFLAVGHQPEPADFALLPRTGRLVLVIDDAHTVDRIAAIAVQLWQQRPDARLLLSARPYGETELQTELWKLNLPKSALMQWKLADLTHTEATELVSELVARPVTDLFTRQLATISADCPFLAVVAADLLKRGQLAGTTLASDAALRDEVFGRFSVQMTGGLAGVDASQRRDVLQAIAAYQPVRLDDDDFVVAISAVTGIESWDAINGRIHELEDAGLVLRRGTNAIRVVPDMFGDVLLGQAAYDPRSHRATSFMSRARAAASGRPLQHLLVNGSRMDWQVRDGRPTEADIVGGLWAALSEELLSAEFAEQIVILKLVAKIAYYQPERALALVEAVLAPAPPSWAASDSEPASWAVTQADVVRETVPVLRNVAYHLDQLRPALEILWSLAQDDTRPTNQHPDHPLRVLRQIADLSTGKPFVYLDEVIDAATDWFNTPSRLSPFDVIEPVLATEGSDETSSDLTLTFRAFGIEPGSVREVRSRVVELAFAQTLGDDVPTAIRAIKTLQRAIRGPVGMFNRQPSDRERDAWSDEFAPIIRRLGELGADPARDPALRVAIREAVEWHAANGRAATKPVARAALDSIVTTVDDELALCLHGGSGRMALRAGLNYEEAEKNRVETYQRVSALISQGRTDRQVLEHLENRLRIESVTGANGVGNARLFMFDFFAFSPTSAATLVESILTSDAFPQLRLLADVALGTLATKLDDRAIGFVRTMLAGSDERLQVAAANALSWNRRPRTTMLPGEIDALAIMADHLNDDVRLAAGRAVVFIGMTDKAVALDLLAKIKFGGITKVGAEALSGFVLQGPLAWSDTNAALRESILAQLIDCPSLDEYELTAAISELSKVDPVRVTKFLMSRVDRRAELQDYRYDALPYHWEPALRIQETNSLARCLGEVRKWMSDSGHDRSRYYMQNDGADLFKLVAGDWTDQAFVALSDLTDAKTEDELVSVARIVGHAPIALILQQVDLVTKILRTGESLSKASGELIGQALLPTNYGVVSMWSGQQPTKELRERDKAVRLATQLPQGSIESRFYRALADSIDNRLNFTMSRDEPRLDRRDW